MWWRTGFVTLVLIIALMQANNAVSSGMFSNKLLSGQDSSRTVKKSITVPKTDAFFAPDKGKHFMASLYSTVFIAKLSEKTVSIDKDKARSFAVCITLGLGVAKEFADKHKTGGFFSWKDLLADLAGISVGLIILNQP